MPAAAWIALATVVSGILWTVAWFMVQRQIKRTDDLERDLYHPEGTVAKMRGELQAGQDAWANRTSKAIAAVTKAQSEFISQEDLDVSATAILYEVRRQRADGVRREQRIVDAIVRGRNEVKELVKEVRGENKTTNERVDTANERIDRINDRSLGR